MDGGLNKIAAALIAVFVLTFLLLVAQILYVLLSRRRYVHGGAAQPNKEKCVYLFCWRNHQSRIEPKEIASKIHDDSEMAAVDDELEKWRELCGPSRELFTIKEEEEREGIESIFEYDTTAFHTPCDSPPYFTPSPSPSPSPTRDVGNFPVETDSSDDNRTAPFWVIEISGD